jgi:hypothetical protein
MLMLLPEHFIVYIKYRIDINHLYKFFIKLYVLFKKSLKL